MAKKQDVAPTKPTAAPRVLVDWERIEPDWRAGIKSVLQIAADYEKATGRKVSHTAINKHFKGRDVDRAIKVRSQDKVVFQEADERDTSGFLYVVYIDANGERFYKIGLSKNFGNRFASHQGSSPFEVCVAACYFVGNMRTEERELHEQFAQQRVRGEWFRLSFADLQSIAVRSLLVNHG